MEGLNELREQLERENYIADDTLAVTLMIAMKLGKPLLIEGAAGVGKTEVAKTAARIMNRELVRLQCYDGLDEARSLYEWNYQKQLLAIQMGADGMSDLFGEEYLLERPLLKSIRSDKPVVLLIDEIDKSDDRFEAFLLELLSEMQVTIPEYGTVKARTIPFVILTSNHTRPLSEALRRRCAYMYIDYPDVEKEVRIIRAKLPGIDEQLANQVARAIAYLRSNEHVLKKPSVAETLDWANALAAIGAVDLDDETCAHTINFALKNNDDIENVLNDESFIRSLF